MHPRNEQRHAPFTTFSVSLLFIRPLPTLYYTFLKHDCKLYSKYLRCFCFNLVFKKKPKLFQHILNCVKWVAIELIFRNLFSCNLKLYIQTVIWPLKWHSIVQNYNVTSDGFIPFFSLVLCSLNRQNFFYDIKYIFSQSEIVVQPELNYMKKETIYLIKYMIITIEHIFNLFD